MIERIRNSVSCIAPRILKNLILDRSAGKFLFSIVWLKNFIFERENLKFKQYSSVAASVHNLVCTFWYDKLRCSHESTVAGTVEAVQTNEMFLVGERNQ